MKKIFLLAKYYAHQKSASSIGLEHVKEALKNLEIEDVKAKEIIYKRIGGVSKSEAVCIKRDYTQDALKIEKIQFDEHVKELKEELEKNGFSLETDISDLLLVEPSKLEMFKNIKNLKNKLNEQVFSQEMAIESICDKLSEAVYIKNEKAPKAIMFFLGPPATGKTYLPEVLSQNLDGYAFDIFDMSTYSSDNQGFALFGLSKGYSNAGEGKLTKFVKEHPKSILVFDEVEKAHPSILQNFLYLLSQGEAKDEFTQEMVDFRESIFIFTSNLGSELYSNRVFLEKLKNDASNAQSMLLDTISRETKLVNGHQVKILSPEFLSRVSQGDVILFNKLPFDSYLKIIMQSLDKNIQAFEHALNIEVSIEDMSLIASALLLGFLPDFDVRRIKSKTSYVIFDKITDFFRDGDVDVVSKINIDVTEQTKEIVKNILNKNKDEKKEFLLECFRKSFTYTYDLKLEFNDGALYLSIDGIKKSVIQKSKDFQGEGAINVEVPNISFSNIAGHKKAKESLNQIIQLLKNPTQLKKHDIDIPKGMLLYGVPGTGKTMLAKAFAKEADLPFISTTGTEILDVEFMKKIFKRAREYAPSIIFIDEMDAIGYRDGSRADIIINQFLTELNGFGDSDDNVFVVGATNFKGKIDPAILRSGRIDQHVEIENLDKEARRYFIDKLLKVLPHSDMDIDKLLIYTAGMSGADLEKVKRESSLYMIKHNIAQLTQDILLEQINTIKYGEKLQGSSLENLVAGTAYHEAGHAVISYLLMPEIKIEQITVIPRNNALGFVSYNNEDNHMNITKKYIEDKICVLLAGRAAQMKQFSQEGFDSGASGDLAQASYLANYAITELGMGASIGYTSLVKLSENQSQSLREEANQEIKEWLESAKKRVELLVQEHWAKIESVAKTLIEKESIEAQELGLLINFK